MLLEIQWEPAEKMLNQEICVSYESLMKGDHWKRTRSLSYGSKCF